MSIATAAAKYFDLWWEHHSVWLNKKEIFSPELRTANERVGAASNTLRGMFTPYLAMLPAPVNCTKDEYIQRLNLLKEAA